MVQPSLGIGNLYNIYIVLATNLKECPRFAGFSGFPVILIF
ncbi:MAG TPA: hypothetical protein VKM55_20540 [Candidatus Lokiarchaeia archaeon]|nr:hypothetical protein [Candidatus Lokiarchaeia archaeon]